MTEIGMNFDFNVILDNTHLILIITLALMFTKETAIFFGVMRFCNIKTPMAFHTALLICQSGEFAFIIFELASDADILNEMQLQILSVVVGLSMAFTPLFAAIGKKYERRHSFQLKPNMMLKIFRIYRSYCYC